MPEGSGKRLPARLLVFDLDGTLIDSRRDLANAVNQTLAYLSRPPLSPERIAGYIGDGATALVERSLAASGGCEARLLSRAMPFFLGYYREHKLDFTFVYDGVLTGLSAMRERAPRLPMAVLTNKPVGPSCDICDALGLTPFFFAIYGGDSFPSKKPHPEGLRHLIERASSMLGATIRAEEVVLVGDSGVDVATARAAGARSLGCSYGFAPAALTAASPDALVGTPQDWLSALDLLF